MNYVRLLVLLLSFSLAGETVRAEQIAGVDVTETTQLADGTELVLNGTGTRKMLFVSVYVGALYLPAPASQATAVFDEAVPKRMRLHVVYERVARERLVKAWQNGFERNTPAAMLATLKTRIDAFNALFDTAVEGDVVDIDYLPTTGTQVRINGVLRGTIDGADFQRAVFGIWLGDNPVSESLKSELLGG